MTIELPVGHTEICRHSEKRFAISITKCRASDCCNFHVFIESFGHKHSFVYGPEEAEKLEDAFTVIFQAAIDIVTETAVQEMRWTRYVN